MTTHRLLVLLVLMFAVAPTLQAQDNTPELVIHVAVIDENLNIKPVPKHPFAISSLDTTYSISVSTGFDGKARLQLPAGRYHLASEEPLSFEGTIYDWDMDINVPEGGLVLELSNDNAEVDTSQSGPDVEMSVGELFDQNKDAVVTVFAEGGHGSGFLIDGRGFVMTNHHVIEGSEYLAVKLPSGGKYPAKVLSTHPHRDVAILLVNPAAFEGIPALRLATDPEAVADVKVGDAVVAIGSPLTTEGIITSGIISKIEEDVYYSDVNINPGNSGGPLMTLDGTVIGINTFGTSAEVGPGVSGIVRIHEAADTFDAAVAALEVTEPPELRPLPELPTDSFPADALREIALQGLDFKNYHVEFGKMDINIVTPPLIASLSLQAEQRAEAQQKKRSQKSAASTDPGDIDGFYEWRRYAGDFTPVVTIQVTPEVKLTGGSTFAKIMLGNVPGKYRFKTDFVKMRLLRDGLEVEPIHPGRVRTVMTQQVGVDRLDDIGVYGAYKYSPLAFAPGADLVLQVFDTEHMKKPKEMQISTVLQCRIWTNFYPVLKQTGVQPSGWCDERLKRAED